MITMHWYGDEVACEPYFMRKLLLSPLIKDLYLEVRFAITVLSFISKNNWQKIEFVIKY